ncbi:hypothetical protein CTAYLR_007411 [Chrysophaeum taylorii]|uniref:COMM domain-containing protein 3 n=1 Tax=Chrysophaeum taylorii TaxID=2483200 RepID=A0AAD7U6H5_9STRA|nr:hypothetical protein CTAYLR_007411 [Chrysophaeum taylorii]
MSVFGVFAELDGVPTAAFEKLATLSLALVAKDPRVSERDVEALYESLGGEGLAKRSYAGLAALAADMARLDAGASQVVSSLEENGLTDSAKIGFFGAAFERAKPAIRLELDATLGVVLPKLVDIDWRLDYVVRSSDDGPAVPVYYVTLHVASENNDTIDLALSVEQMQDLLLTVRDANHQAARLGAAAAAVAPSST